MRAVHPPSCSVRQQLPQGCLGNQIQLWRGYRVRPSDLAHSTLVRDIHRLRGRELPRTSPRISPCGGTNNFDQARPLFHRLGQWLAQRLSNLSGLTSCPRRLGERRVSLSNHALQGVTQPYDVIVARGRGLRIAGRQLPPPEGTGVNSMPLAKRCDRNANSLRFALDFGDCFLLIHAESICAFIRIRNGISAEYAVNAESSVFPDHCSSAKAS